MSAFVRCGSGPVAAFALTMNKRGEAPPRQPAEGLLRVIRLKLTGLRMTSCFLVAATALQ